MRWSKDSPPAIQVVRVVSSSQGNPVEARIKVSLVVSCPVCSREQQVAYESFATTADGWDQEIKFFPWALPHMYDTLPWIVDRMVGEDRRCEDCGTNGGLTVMNAEALKQAFAELMPQSKFVSILEELGFHVDHQRNRFFFAGSPAAISA